MEIAQKIELHFRIRLFNTYVILFALFARRITIFAILCLYLSFDFPHIHISKMLKGKKRDYWSIGRLPIKWLAGRIARFMFDFFPLSFVHSLLLLLIMVMFFFFIVSLMRLLLFSEALLTLFQTKQGKMNCYKGVQGISTMNLIYVYQK